jgi:thioredoxin 1
MGIFGALAVNLPAVTVHASGPTPSELISGAVQDVPIPGKVTMVDLGAHKCIPCKMMTPILKELSLEYEGRAAIVFIDVWENLNVTGQFGIRTIPTQIFYDAEGNEQLRHTGFLDKASIVKVLRELGVN